MKYFLPFFLLASPLLLMGDTGTISSAIMLDPAIQDTLNKLQVEIQKQQDFVAALQKQIARKDVLQDSSIVFRYENAVAMLSIKRTLYANFINTPSLKSPLIRDKLLAIFQKEMIMEGDLAELQALVTQERQKQTTSDEPAAPPQ